MIAEAPALLGASKLYADMATDREVRLIREQPQKNQIQEVLWGIAPNGISLERKTA